LLSTAPRRHHRVCRRDQHVGASTPHALHDGSTISRLRPRHSRENHRNSTPRLFYRRPPPSSHFRPHQGSVSSSSIEMSTYLHLVVELNTVVPLYLGYAASFHIIFTPTVARVILRTRSRRPHEYIPHRSSRAVLLCAEADSIPIASSPRRSLGKKVGHQQVSRSHPFLHR